MDTYNRGTRLMSAGKGDRYRPVNRQRYAKNYAAIFDEMETTMHDSGERQEFETGAVRDTADGKSRPDLISPYAQIREGEWMRKGAAKYAERNWEKGIPISRCIASLERHLLAYKMGAVDEDHMAAIRTNASFILHFETMIAMGMLPASLDDMPHYEQGNTPCEE